MRATGAAAIALALTACSQGSATAADDAGVEAACAAPTVITPGGAFEGDTCQGGISVGVGGCAPGGRGGPGGPGGRAQVFEVTPESQSWNRVFHVTDGFTLAGSGYLCQFETTECDAGGIESASIAANTAWYLAVLQADGGCGPFTLEVFNATSCENREDGGSCRCGDIASCPQGQSCHIGPPPQLAGSCVSN
jgi:hypothetical protein